MKRFNYWAIGAMVALGGGLTLAGCRDDAPSPRRVPVPAADQRDRLRERDEMKPLPADLSPRTTEQHQLYRSPSR